MPRTEEWDWPPPRAQHLERIAPPRRHWSAHKGYTRLANGFFSAVIGAYRVALVAALSGVVFASVWLLAAILKT